MLKISAAKVARAIACAREHDAVAGVWESHVQRDFHDETGDGILHVIDAVPVRGTLADFVASLNPEEQVSLLAIAWIGRGTFPPEKLEEAVEKATGTLLSPEGADLTGVPLLAEYLRDGMEKLGLPA